MVFDAVEIMFDGGDVIQIAPAVLVPVRTLVECHGKNLDIGSRHNTQTAWVINERVKDPKEKKNKKYVIASLRRVKVLSHLRSYHAPSAPDG
jgi:hypothetical protein